MICVMHQCDIPVSSVAWRVIFKTDKEVFCVFTPHGRPLYELRSPVQMAILMLAFSVAAARSTDRYPGLHFLTPFVIVCHRSGSSCSVHFIVATARQSNCAIINFILDMIHPPFLFH
jgi:hypothetical protein